MTTLIVAAMREEVSALRAILGTRRDYRVAVVGETAARAGRALEALIERHAPSRLLLLGVCGGLSPELGPCDLLLADDGGCDPDWLAALPVHLGRRGRLVSVDRVVAGADAKRALAEKLGPDALAVDLETETLTRIAHARGVRCLVIRAVSDTADESMPAFVQRCFRDDGSMSRVRVVLAANVRPRRWRVLMAMRRRMQRCATKLAEAAALALDCAPT